MGISRLTPFESATRLLTTTLAGVVALAVIALGVQIGTTGLGFDEDRAPATATARRASTLVDLAASGGTADLAAMLVGLLPPDAQETMAGAAAPQVPQAAPQPRPTGANEPPALTPPAPAPIAVVPPSPIASTPAPLQPAPLPPATVPPTAPPATAPPAPGSAPAVEPVTDPVTQTIEDVGGLLGL